MIRKEDILPRDKFDEERALNLFNFSKDDLKPFIPDLLEWLQDRNWPISDIVLRLLINFKEELIPHFENIFKTNDDIWKYNCLRFINCYMTNKDIEKLKTILERFAYYPTKGELEEEDVSLEAIELLKRIKNNNEN